MLLSTHKESEVDMKLKSKWAGIAILLLVIYKYDLNLFIGTCIGYFCMNNYLEERG